MGRVGVALFAHEFLERTRDRWVVVVSLVFGLLASAVSLYARGADASASRLTGPSLVTLIALVVPLVALILGHDAVVGERERNTLGLLLTLPVGKLEIVLAKFLGRTCALCAAIGLGLGSALLLSLPEERTILAQLVLPTVALGTSFLSIGVLVSAFAKRQITAASAVVVIWFLFVFFYDLGLLGILVLTDGQVPSQMIAGLVAGNPAGLFRVDMLLRFVGSSMVDYLGADAKLPTRAGVVAIWSAWIVLPVLASAVMLWRERGKR